MTQALFDLVEDGHCALPGVDRARNPAILDHAGTEEGFKQGAAGAKYDVLAELLRAMRDFDFFNVWDV
jgi:hypothetical protein